MNVLFMCPIYCIGILQKSKRNCHLILYLGCSRRVKLNGELQNIHRATICVLIIIIVSLVVYLI